MIDNDLTINPRDYIVSPATGKLWPRKLIDEYLWKIAMKHASTFGLKERDFAIHYMKWWEHAFKTARSGSVVKIYFGLVPDEPEFLLTLRRALEAAKRERDGKPQIQLLSEFEGALVKDKNWASLPKLPPRDDLVIEEMYKVVVKHRRTGMIVARESKKPQFTRMIIEARIELAEKLSIVELDGKGKLP